MRYTVEMKGYWKDYNEDSETAAKNNRFTATITIEAGDAEAAISAARSIDLYNREAVRVQLVELAEGE